MSLQQRLATSFDGVDLHHPEAFWLGAVATTVVGLLHLPVYIGAGGMGYHLVGMPVDTPMLVGMFLIIVGLISAFYGLFPSSGGENARAAVRIRVRALDEVPIGAAHVGLLVVMAIA